jgi:hypothetical protein
MKSRNGKGKQKEKIKETKDVKEDDFEDVC